MDIPENGTSRSGTVRAPLFYLDASDAGFDIAMVQYGSSLHYEKYCWFSVQRRTFIQ